MLTSCVHTNQLHKTVCDCNYTAHSVFVLWAHLFLPSFNGALTSYIHNLVFGTLICWSSLACMSDPYFLWVGYARDYNVGHL